MSSNSAALFQRLVEVIKALRTPVTGCPWDLEQTHDSIRPYLVEETYEVLDALESKDDNEFSAELGDLLLQVVLHAQIAADRKAFDIDTVVQKITEKMIRRHPHVFGTTKVEGAEEVLRNWETIKLKEKEGVDTKRGGSALLSGVPRAMPALLRAQRLGEKASKVGFDWDSVEGVWAKVREELDEIQQELPQGDSPQNEEERSRLGSEIGDVLFALCQLSRWLNLSAEDCLKGSSDRFVSRFAEMEKIAPRPLSELKIDELETLWQSAKLSQK